MIWPSSTTASRRCAPPKRPLRWTSASAGASSIKSVLKIRRALEEPVTTTQVPVVPARQLAISGLSQTRNRHPASSSKFPSNANLPDMGGSATFMSQKATGDTGDGARVVVVVVCNVT